MQRLLNPDPLMNESFIVGLVVHLELNGDKIVPVTLVLLLLTANMSKISLCIASAPVLGEKRCKGTAIFGTTKTFSNFFSKKNDFLGFFSKKRDVFLEKRATKCEFFHGNR